MSENFRQTGPSGFIMIGPKGEGMVIPFSDNKSWLTLFYLLPREILDKRKEYYAVPRCPYEVIRTDKYDELIGDDLFLELVWDSYAWAIWNNFVVPKQDGTYRPIPGIDLYYSGDFPLWRLAYHCVALMRRKFERTGLGFQELYNYGPDEEVDFLSYRHWWNLVGNTLDLIIEEEKLQPMIDEIWNNRTPEDYSEYYSKVKAAFGAQWNHSRTKTGRNMVSLEALMERSEDRDPDHFLSSSYEFEGNLAEKFMMERFMGSVNEKDREILKLKLDGFTDQEISEKVGYKTHSAVVKRMQKIREVFDDFIKEEYDQYKETLES